MKRKYPNGYTITVTKPNAYNFTKLVIRKKCKSRKNDLDINYLCDTWIKGNSDPITFIVSEKQINEFVNYLGE